MNPVSSAQIAAVLDSGKFGAVARQPPTGSPEGGFSGLFQSAAQEIHRLDAKAQTAVMGVLNGEGVEVHEAMIATQKAELTFQLALQVRNKAVAAYQQMMQMQF